MLLSVAHGMSNYSVDFNEVHLKQKAWPQACGWHGICVLQVSAQFCSHSQLRIQHPQLSHASGNLDSFHPFSTFRLRDSFELLVLLQLWSPSWSPQGNVLKVTEVWREKESQSFYSHLWRIAKHMAGQLLVNVAILRGQRMQQVAFIVPPKSQGITVSILQLFLQPMFKSTQY